MSEIALLREACTLEDVIFHEVSARVMGDGNRQLGGTIGLRIRTRLDEEDDTPTERSFGISLPVRMDTENGRAQVEPAAIFSVPADAGIDLSDELILQFANDEAIAILLPFARQALRDITEKVFGTGELMPILKPGEIRFDAEEVSA